MQRRRSAATHRIGATAEEGQALIEYALILALIAVLTIGALMAMGKSVSGLLGQVSGGMTQVLNS
jgi:Flp pilus assembly pilin Flp